jgi:MFS family permease
VETSSFPEDGNDVVKGRVPDGVGREQPSGAEDDSIRAVLRNRAFLRLWLIQAFTQTAQNIVNFALLLRVRDVVEVHGVAQANTAIGLVILAFSLPAVLFGPVAGVVADRANKRQLMALLNVARAAAVFLFLVIRPGWHVETILAAYYIVTFLFGIAGQFFAPLQGAVIPLIVPRAQLTSANALFNLTSTAAQLAGFALAGPILVKFLGIDTMFIVISVVYLGCAGLVMTLPPTPAPERVPSATLAPMQRLRDEIVEGLVFVYQDPALMRAIGYLTIASTTFLMVATLGPEYITSVIGLSKEDIGYVVGPAGVGVLAGVLFVPRVVRLIGREWLIDSALAMAGLSLAMLALAPGLLHLAYPGDAPQTLVLVVTMVNAVLLGVCNAFVLVPAQTILQERSHDAVRARVYATFFTISNTVSFVPIFFAAAFADLFGVVQVLTIVALLVGGLGVSSLLQRRTAEFWRWDRVRTLHRQGPEALPLSLRGGQAPERGSATD